MYRAVRGGIEVIYEQIVITTGRSSHDKRCFAFILGYSSLSHAPWGPISRWFIGRVLITYHRPHTCLRLGLVLYASE